ncbi:MAG: 50S ribosomal protein L10 [Actinomycetota bacterium]
MENPRPEKVAVVTEVRERLEQADGAIVTEYRGMTVAEIQTLRKSLQASGGDYKVFKNTLVRRAVADTPNAGITDLLVGPTGIAFVQGDVSAAAKALRDYAKATPALVLKGGVVDGSVLSAADVTALADLPSREVLLSMFAGALAAPMRNLAGLFKAIPQSLAYGLKALLDTKPAAEVAAPAAAPVEEAEAAPAAEEEPVADASEDVAVAAEEPTADAPTEEAPAAEEPESGDSAE